MIKDWFTYRGLKVLKYQSEVLQKIEKSMQKQEITVLAACPSAGKTIMSIYCIENYLIEHPLAKVLVLTHGTTVLRTQFHDVLEETKPAYTYNLVAKFSEFDYSKQVNVCLPQTINGNLLPHFDLLVVDEAHQFYFADMVQEIIKRIAPSKQLLLTGTPSVFIQRGFSIIPIPLLRIYDEGMIADVRVEIATSSYNFDIIKDYNEDKELKSEIEILENETTKTLDELLSKIIAKLNNNNSIHTWSQTLAELKKTMFACKSQQQAVQVKQYFDNIGIKSALSISDIDTDSTEIWRFKTETDCLILIVVGRGILGFNYAELVNIVDMTTSQNIDRIYQLFCRVVRKHSDGDKKLFFKIAPKDKSDYYKYIMTGVLALSSEEFFCKFNGKNFDDIKIPVIKNNKTYHYNYKTRKCVRTDKDKIYKPIDFSNFPVLEFFKDVYENNKTLSTYTMTDIKEVRAEFLSRKPYNGMKRTTSVLELHLMNRCMEVARKYLSVRRWERKDNANYQIAVKYGWLDLCTEHMLFKT